jgi:prophage antirepressor-like protein
MVPPPSTLAVFDVSGADIRFGLTEDGTPYSVAADFAKSMGYRQTKNALDLLDDVEKGFALAETPGGRQRLAVIYEDGMWELIFRSTLPGAKAIKARVKAILREIRETGSYSAEPTSQAAPALPQDYEEALVHLLDKVRENKQLESKVRELEPAAQAWDVLASASGDYSLRDAAHILNRDTAISTGQNRLLRSIREFEMIDRNGVPYAKHAAHLVERATSYNHPHTGEPTLSKQIRVTVQGLRYLHRRLGGEGPLQLPLDGAA